VPPVDSSRCIFARRRVEIGGGGWRSAAAGPLSASICPFLVYAENVGVVVVALDDRQEVDDAGYDGLQLVGRRYGVAEVRRRGYPQGTGTPKAAVADEGLALLAHHGDDRARGGGPSRLFVVRTAPEEQARRKQ